MTITIESNSAIGNGQSAIPPAPRGAAWIDLHECARRMSLASADVVRRFHVREWHQAGLARHEKPAGGGKARWVVRDDADARLSRVKQPEQLGTEILKNLTDAQRATVNDRLRLINQWEDQRAAGVKLDLSETKITASFLDRLLIDEGRRLSRATLFNWLAGYRREGIAGICDDRWKIANRKSQIDSDPFLDEVKRLYLSLRRPKLTVCHEIACLKADEQGWEKRGYKTCQRFIDLIPRSVVLKHRFGEEAHTNDAAPFIECDYSQLASNEVWCGDHHRFDEVVQIGEKLDARTGEKTPIYDRPWGTFWMDERSRKIVGWMIFAHDPNQDTVLETFFIGVTSHGVPEKIRIDNGKDYDSYALQGMTKKQRRKLRVQYDAERMGGVFGQIGVKVAHVTPYHGQSKVIERFFGTLEDRFGRTWETYCGNSPANKPEDLEDKIKAGRAPLLADFVAGFEAWLDNDYHQRVHAGDGMDGRCPATVWSECLATKVTCSAELAELLCLKPTQPITVAQNGVTWQGLRYGQFEPSLHSMIKQKVQLRIDPRDISRVTVWSLDGKFICVAPANQKVPKNADAQVLRTAIAERGRMNKLDREHRRIRPRLSEDLPDAMIRAAAKRNAENAGSADPTLPPPSLRPVRSPLEEQLPAIQRAFERPRIAVGAESASELLASSYIPQNNDAAETSQLGDVTSYLRYRPEDRDE